jgi:hypothetical protein
MKQSPHVRRILFTYSNTITEISGEKFRAFKKQLKKEYSCDSLTKCERLYHKWRTSDATQKAEFVRQLLDFKDER